MKKATDFTAGNPFKEIVWFSVPSVLGVMLQNLYTLADSVIVSLSRGSLAATGVNLTGSINFFVLGFSLGITMGFGVVLAQYKGARDEDKMRKSLATSVRLSVELSLLLSLTAVLSTKLILELMATSDLYFSYAEEYLTVLFAGITFTTLYNLSSQVMRAVGDSETPLVILILCSTLNVLLDALMFLVPSLGAWWAAFATVISQGVSALVGFLLLLRRFKDLRPKKGDWKINGAFSVHHLKAGLPMALQYMITASGCMIQQKAFNDLPGELYEMAQSTGSKIDNIFNSVAQGVGMTMAPYIGQNYGAKDFGRIKKGMTSAMLALAIFSVIGAAGAMLTAVPFARILLPADTIPAGGAEDVYDGVFRYLATQSVFYFALGMLHSGRNGLQGIGHGGLTIVGGTAEMLIRLLAAVTISVWFGFNGACFMNVLAWVIGAVVNVGLFYVFLKKEEKKFSQKT